MPAIRCLIIDNYDSFTFNIRERLGAQGIDALVVRNNEVELDDIARFTPTHIILSPGPGTPEHAEDVGISFEAVNYAITQRIPLLGVCLGHQVIAKHFGGRIVQAPRIVHGSFSKLVRCSHTLSFPDLFDRCTDEELRVMRYHSLAAEVASLPPCLVPTATTRCEDEADRSGNPTIMALQHRELPIYGVQFHPESRFTPCGDHLLNTFIHLPSPASLATSKKILKSMTDSKRQQASVPKEIVELLTQVLSERRRYGESALSSSLDPADLYESLSQASDACYLFESLPPPGTPLLASGEHRFAYLGWAPRFTLQARNHQCFLNGKELQLPEGTNPFAVLAYIVDMLSVTEHDAVASIMLTGGMVGYFSYEAVQYRESAAFPGRTPDDQWTFDMRYYDDSLHFDRSEHHWVYATRGRSRVAEAKEFLADVRRSKRPNITGCKDEVTRQEFERRVADVIQKEIVAGNAQQVVLSRRKTFTIDGQLAQVYRTYREIAPSVNMHAMKCGDIETVGSFPELMVHVDQENIRTIQLAGTRRRTGDASLDAQLFVALKADPKDAAEHRMLVDLARNDVARSSVLGSVTVPNASLMYRLDAGPVMHISSTIEGKLDPQVAPTMAFLNIAPMGTVSGSPKVSAMQIIHREERGQPRGLYAGAIGFFDVRGIAEFVVGLRNIIRSGTQIIVQSGAGIVMDSDPKSEYAETEAKMAAPLSAIEPFLSQ